LNESVIVFTLITIIGVVSIFPLTGLTGLFSFGQAAYMAVGAYIAGILAVFYQMPLIVCGLAGVLGCGVLSMIVGYPTLKLRRDFFALMSLFLGEAIKAVLNASGNITGGAQGLSSIPKWVGLPGVIVGTIVVVALVAFMKYSRFGRMCLAIKTDELAAKSFGISVFATKMKVYVFTSMIAGFAGVLYAFYIQYIDPNMFGWTTSSSWVIFLFFGGTVSLTGSVLSAAILTMLPEMLRFASELRTVIYCVIIIAVLNFRPQGLLGDKEISDLFKWIKSKLAKPKKLPDKAA